MAQEYDIKAMAEKIGALKRSAMELKEMSGGMQAVDRNIDRILACIRMLEINISDVLDVI
jgi:hypothetical protein